jgi:protein O-mannosyl-transferase
LMGVFTSIVWLASDLAGSWPSKRWILAAATLAALTGYASVSRTQIGYWRDSYSLFSHALQVTSRNGVAEANLGITFLNVGRFDLAERHLRAAVEFMPDLPISYYDLGVVLQREGKSDEALHFYKLGLSYTNDPEDAARTHNNIGAILLDRNDLPGAMAQYNTALRLNPDEPHSLLGRGVIEYRHGQFDSALADLTKSAQWSASPDTYFYLGQVYESKGNSEAAVRSYETALQLNPKFAEASSRLAALAPR